jgi:hypothetical protein
MELSLTSNP